MSDCIFKYGLHGVVTMFECGLHIKYEYVGIGTHVLQELVAEVEKSVLGAFDKCIKTWCV